MNRTFLTVVGVFSILTTSVYGQLKFKLNNVSSMYQVLLDVPEYDEAMGVCHGAGKVTLLDKQTRKKVQVIQTNVFFYWQPEAASKPEKGAAKPIELDTEKSPIHFEDFNFDGIEDLTIRTELIGNSLYSHNIYVYDPSLQQFGLHQALTELASSEESDGMFTVDPKRKRLITSGKSGWAEHFSTEYEFSDAQTLVKVYEWKSQLTSKHKEIITEKKLVQGKWVVTTQTKKVKETND